MLFRSTPSTYSELSQMITASLQQSCPVAIRYPKHLGMDKRDFDGSWNVLAQCDNAQLTILAVGNKLTNVALQIANAVPNVDVVEVTTVKPLDRKYLDAIKAGTKVVTLEENVLQGGFGQSVAAYLREQGINVANLGVDDTFVKHASVDEQIFANGLDFDSLNTAVEELLSKS